MTGPLLSLTIRNTVEWLDNIICLLCVAVLMTAGLGLAVGIGG